MTDEKDELKSTSASLIEELTKAKQDLKQVSAKIETLETKLQAALLEVEAVKASEERALSQVSRVPLFCWLLTSSAVVHGICTWRSRVRCGTFEYFPDLLDKFSRPSMDQTLC